MRLREWDRDMRLVVVEEMSYMEAARVVLGRRELVLKWDTSPIAISFVI